MKSLIHYIYASTANFAFDEKDLSNLLKNARAKNARLGITGILLYTEGSFFQILEGEAEKVDALIQEIAQDPRHRDVVTIIREPISLRAFNDWSMGFSNIGSQELKDILGGNDFFAEGSCFQQVTPGRAKKILKAFRDGRWRARVRSIAQAEDLPVTDPKSLLSLDPGEAKVSFAYQPIVDRIHRRTVAYDAQVRGLQNEPCDAVLDRLTPAEWELFDTHCRRRAITLAAKLGLDSNLCVKLLARNTRDADTALRATLSAAEAGLISPQQVILNVDFARLIGDPTLTGQAIEAYRGMGMKVSVDHFGFDCCSLGILENFHPSMIALSSDSMRGIATSGPRQAVVRGIVQTCRDLDIDLVVRQVQPGDDYRWFCDEGISLFQGDLFAAPTFERFPDATYSE